MNIKHKEKYGELKKVTKTLNADYTQEVYEELMNILDKKPIFRYAQIPLEYVIILFYEKAVITYTCYNLNEEKLKKLISLIETGEFTVKYLSGDLPVAYIEEFTLRCNSIEEVLYEHSARH